MVEITSLGDSDEPTAFLFLEGAILAVVVNGESFGRKLEVHLYESAAR